MNDIDRTPVRFTSEMYGDIHVWREVDSMDVYSAQGFAEFGELDSMRFGHGTTPEEAVTDLLRELSLVADDDEDEDTAADDATFGSPVLRGLDLPESTYASIAQTYTDEVTRAEEKRKTFDRIFGKPGIDDKKLHIWTSAPTGRLNEPPAEQSFPEPLKSPDGQEVDWTAPLPEDFIDNIRAGTKILAIKQYRQARKTGLRDAKTFVDSIEQELAKVRGGEVIRTSHGDFTDGGIYLDGDDDLLKFTKDGDGGLPGWYPHLGDGWGASAQGTSYPNYPVVRIDV